jgi:hypothetical protein
VSKVNTLKGVGGTPWKTRTNREPRPDGAKVHSRESPSLQGQRAPLAMDPTPPGYKDFEALFRSCFMTNSKELARTLALRRALPSQLPAGGAEQQRVLPHDPGLAYRIQSFRDAALIKGIPVLERNA